MERNNYTFLYTRNGKATLKWILVTSALTLFALGCLVLVFYLASHPLGPLSEVDAEPGTVAEAPDFSSIGAVDERKRAFFSFLTPLVRQENKAILATRQRILHIRDELMSRDELASQDELSSQDMLSKPSRKTIARLVKEYRFEDEALSVADKKSVAGQKSVAEQIDRLLRRVDTIPVSMVLAQAAIESAWGTSRFARLGNNFFGQQCFQPGCGAVPRRRGEGASHEVAVFDSVRDSVRSYFRNINTHRAYRGIRQMRAALRQADRPVGGLELIEGLSSYSERGQDYIEELRQIIRGNNLAELDEPVTTAAGNAS